MSPLIAHAAEGSSATQTDRTSRKFLFLTFGLMGMITLALLVWSLARFGNLSAGISFLSGERLFLDPRMVDVGSLDAGEARLLRITLHNATDQRIRVLGSETSCSCSTAEALPGLLLPNSSSALVIRVDASRKVGDLGAILKIFTDYEPEPILRFQVTGSVRELGVTSTGTK